MWSLFHGNGKIELLTERVEQAMRIELVNDLLRRHLKMIKIDDINAKDAYVICGPNVDVLFADAKGCHHG